MKINDYKNYGLNYIFVNNGSTDNSIDFINTNFSSITTIALDKNYGFAQGYNLGLKKILTLLKHS